MRGSARVSNPWGGDTAHAMDDEIEGGGARIELPGLATRDVHGKAAAHRQLRRALHCAEPRRRLSGAGDRTRTDDLRITSALLYH